MRDKYRGSLSRPSAAQPYGASRAFAAAAAMLLTLALVALLHLQYRFQSDLDARLAQAQSLLADRSVLNTPADPTVRFAALEDIVQKIAHSSSGLRAITIGKVISPPGIIRVVHPHYVPALYPADSRSVSRTATNPDLPQRNRDYLLPWALPADARALPLEVDGQILGWLYARVDQTAIFAVRAVLAAIFIMLVAAIAFFARQLNSQQLALSATTIELDTIRRELSRLERLAMAGQLSANLLHDLRKPMLNIRAELEDLRSDAPAQIPTGESAARAHERMARQADLFFSLLRETNFERLLRQPGDREYVDLPDIIERSLALVKFEKRGVTVHFSTPPPLPPILSEPVRLIQVFSNLFLNAYQALQGRGHLEIRVELPGQGRVEIIIEDDGPGIADDLKSRAFEPFVTSRATTGGTGLGLYIVRETMRELGGDALLEDSPRGAKFRLWLPATQASTPPAQ